MSSIALTLVAAILGFGALAVRHAVALVGVLAIVWILCVLAELDTRVLTRGLARILARGLSVGRALAARTRRKARTVRVALSHSS